MGWRDSLLVGATNGNIVNSYQGWWQVTLHRPIVVIDWIIRKLRRA